MNNNTEKNIKTTDNISPSRKKLGLVAVIIVEMIFGFSFLFSKLLFNNKRECIITYIMTSSFSATHHIVPEIW